MKIRITLLLALFVTIAGADEKPVPKKKVVLPPEWASIEIHTGGGSCWGEWTGLYLTLTKTEGGGEVAIRARDDKVKTKPRTLNSKELKKVTDRLVDYCTYFSGNGYRAPNSWLLHKVDYTLSKGGARGTLLAGTALGQNLKSEEFHIWLRSLHTEAEPLFAETYWKERRESDEARAKKKPAELGGARQPATAPDSKPEGKEKTKPESKRRSQ